MIVNHEVPKFLLNISPEFNEYDFCLPHLLDQDKEYLKYFKEAKAKGRYVIMDNSLHELKDENGGHGYDHSRLLFWVKELEPDEFIVPDVWMDCHQTAAQAKYWKQFKFPKKTKKIAVIQGKDKNDAYLCARLLRELGYEKLCVSYGATWYNDFFPHSNADMGKALGRVRFVQGLLNLRHLKDIKLHLLGCSIPQEFGWYDNHPQIESIDTSNPVMSALEGVEYKSYGLNTKPTANINNYFDMELDEIGISRVGYNVNKFREINNLNIKTIMSTKKNDSSDMMSLYDYLGKAAGSELGKEVCIVAVQLKETIQERAIENPKYKGNVHLYRREFLDDYFGNRVYEQSEVEPSTGDLQDYQL
jgi:hypothetical protein